MATLERGPVRRRGRRDGLEAPRLEHGEHHDRLAEAHVVGEASAKRETAQKVEPAERIPLIVAELTAKRRRRIGRRDAFKPRQLRAGLLKDFVALDGRLRGQPGVEERRLRPIESDVIALGRAERRDAAMPRQPLLR